MSGLREKKTFYGDGSLKSVCYLDSADRKQGEYIEYQEGTGKVIKRENWLQGLCLYSKEIKPSGKIIETFYDTQGRPKKVNHDGVTIKDFKDGKPFNGPHVVEWSIWDERAFCSEAGLYRNGKKEGIFVFKCYEGGYGNGKDEAFYKDGILQGRYFGHNCSHLLTQETAYIPEIIDVRFFAMNTYIQEGVDVTGYFEQGKFSGEVREYDKEYLVFKNGLLTHAERHAYGDGDHFWDCVYDKDGLVSVKRITKNQQTFVHEIKINGECTLKCNNILVERYFQKNGIKDGLYQKFNKKGRLEEEAQYQNGKLNGIRKLKNEKGFTTLEAEYKDGKLNGTYKEYRNDSVITKYFKDNIDLSDEYFAENHHPTGQYFN